MNAKLMVALWLGLMVSAANAQNETASTTSSSPSKDRPKVESVKTDSDLTADEKRMIELTNAERRKMNLPPLRANATLMKIARDHSANMARLNLLGHTLDAGSFGERLAASGYGSAIAELNESIHRDPENPEHQYVLAYLQRRAGQVDEAQKTIQTARALEEQRSISSWGRLMELFQGPSRVWLEDARRK